jgi:photosystem II stability/assembly factor-like uncharacterized protein
MQTPDLGESVGAVYADPASADTVYEVYSVPDWGDTLLKSIDGGVTWAYSLAGYPRDMVIDPVVPATAYVTASPDDEAGIYKTIDGGVTWTLLTGPPSNQGGYRFAGDVARSDDSTVAASTDLGTYISRDGGGTWAKVGKAGLPIGARFDWTRFDPTDASTVYGAISDRKGFAGVFKSTDGGTSWRGSNSGLTDKTVRFLGVSPTSGSTIYAGTRSGLFRSVDGGNSWSLGSQPGYIGDEYGYVLDPGSGDTVLFGGYLGVFSSSNGGTTWSAEALMDTNITALAVVPGKPETLYAVWKSYALYRSRDGGTTWQVLIPGLQVYGVAVDPRDPGVVYAGLADYYGGVWKSTDGGDHWTMDGPGSDVTYVTVHPLDPDVVFARASRSPDGGESWLDVPDLTYSTQLAFDPLSPDVIYSATGAKYGAPVMRSTDEGITWSVLFNFNPRTMASVVLEPGAPGTIDVAGVWAYRSTDGGVHWTALNDPGSVAINRLAVDPRDGRLYAGGVGQNAGTFLHGVFRWDGGTAWRRVPGAPTAVVNVLSFERGRSVLYVGTSAGIYRYRP